MRIVKFKTEFETELRAEAVFESVLRQELNKNDAFVRSVIRNGKKKYIVVKQEEVR